MMNDSMIMCVFMMSMCVKVCLFCVYLVLK